MDVSGDENGDTQRSRFLPWSNDCTGAVKQLKQTEPKRTQMRSRLILGFLCIFVITLSGCYVSADLHRVYGPPMPESHQAVIKASGIFNSGKFFADLQEDRVFHSDPCRGRWNAAARPKPASANDMASVWDTVNGDGYYATQILGAKKCARGSGTCKQGTVLDAEVCLIENGKNGKTTKVGVARDNKDNIYSIYFFF